MLADALAAALAASVAGVASFAVAEGPRGFRGVPHRLEVLGEHGGVTYVNDSQATIPAATLAALEAFAGRGVILVAGGKDKGLDYGELADAMSHGCRAAVLIGETAGAARGADRRARAGRTGGDHGRRRWPARPRSRTPATSCCSRRRRPASTCSPTTRRAATRSARRSPRSGSETR